MTLEELIAERDALRKIALRGEQSIEFEARRTEFRSWADLKAQLDWLDDQIAQETGETGKFTRVRYVSSCKDLC